MAILIASDCQAKAARVLHHLTHNGYECPLSNIVSIDAVKDAASSRASPPDLIIFILSNHDERTIGILRQLREIVDTPIIAIGPRDPNLILDTLHVGVSDYLDELSDLNIDLTVGGWSFPGRSIDRAMNCR